MAKPSKEPKRETDQQREDEILRRMLNTPPKPHTPKAKRKRLIGDGNKAAGQKK